MLGTLLTIFGLLLTIAFGIYEIWINNKTKRAVSLEFQNVECYTLFKDDINKLNIEVIHGGNVLLNTVILLKAKLLNNGQIDIDKGRIYSPLKIITTEKFNWLETKITSKPNGVNSNLTTISKSEIQLDWDLLKKDECIEFESLIEIVCKNNLNGSNVNEFYTGLSFDFRITDLSSIQKERRVPYVMRKLAFYEKLEKKLFILLTLVGLFVLVISSTPLFNSIIGEITEYQIINDGIQSKAFIYSEGSDKIKLINEDLKEERILSINEFNKTYKIKGIEKNFTDLKNKWAFIIAGIFYILVGGIAYLNKIVKRRKLLKLHLINKSNSNIIKSEL